MKKGLYLRLAGTNIKNNSKIYYPYMLTGICMVMVFYIVTFLSSDPQIKSIRGGTTLQAMLSLGIYVIAIFSAIFLFYTSSFAIKRRKKDFALFNILGMSKHNIGRVMLWETLFISGICIGAGLALGIIFSKLSQLYLLRMMGSTAEYSVYVNPHYALVSAVLYLAIFFVILLNSLRQVHTSNPAQLLSGSKVGEKAPRANWVLALIGVILLGAGYGLALYADNAVAAITLFFVAVLLVILGTYCCFIAGSVALLKVLKKSKKYYYSKKHFVSVSGMTYRMKRNGAGLASICVLSTIVLVMLSSVSCLFIGAEDSIKSRYPFDITADCHPSSEHNIELIQSFFDAELEKAGATAKDAVSYRLLNFAAAYENDGLDTKSTNSYTTANITSVIIVMLDDYNKTTGSSLKLDADEIAVSSKLISFDSETLKMGETNFKVVGDEAKMLENGNAAMSLFGTIQIVVSDSEIFNSLYTDWIQPEDLYNSAMDYYCGFNTELGPDEQIALYNGIRERINSSGGTPDNSFEGERCVASVYSYAAEHDDFYTVYAGLFFLGIILGCVFILATVLIMYYKQVTEGYEDQSRFDIMRKVGMTRREIRKAINSQILTVFFAPLILAGIHVAFAFPMVAMLLRAFNLSNINLFLLITAVSFLVFALFYTVVYFITSKSYYSIVSKS